MLKARSKVAILSCVSVVALLFLTTPTARSDSDDLGGKLSFTGGQSLPNPCNSQTVTGAALFSASVSAEKEDDGQADVIIRVSISATGETDTSGNLYNVHGSGRAEFNTLGAFYWVPLALDYDSPSNPSVSFHALTETLVTVDANQKPLTIPNVGVSETCGGK